MPRVYRSMLHNNGLPATGSLKNMLGVRIPPDSRPAIVPDAEGHVSPGTGGMSVAPRWRDLPYFLIPARLAAFAPGARGSNKLACFRCGEGGFPDAVLNEQLALAVDRPDHGTVQPARRMSLHDYQGALASTRTAWVIDEE